MARRSLYYEVRPRYTSGSPDLVPESVAEQVAQEEKEAYERALKGLYGETDRLRAGRLGLSHIVFERQEKGREWLVNDLITGENRSEPLPSRVKKIFATHPNGQQVEVEEVGADPDERYHCVLVRCVWAVDNPGGNSFSVPRWQLRKTF